MEWILANQCVGELYWKKLELGLFSLSKSHCADARNTNVNFTYPCGHLICVPMP